MDREEVLYIYVYMCVCTHTHCGILAIKKNEMMPSPATWMDLGITILSEARQKREISFDITYMWNL